MWTAIFWVAAIGTLMLGIWAGVAHVEGIGEKRQLAKDQEAITACQTNNKTLVDANLSLQQSVGVIAAERDTQNKKVEDLKFLADEAASIALAWRGKFYAQQTTLQKGQQSARAQSLRPADPKQTCEQVLGEMNADAQSWLPEREARMRDILGLPPVPKAPDTLKVTK